MKYPALLLLILLASCTRKNMEELGPEAHLTTPFEIEPPHYFPVLDIPANNPLTEEGIELGRRLYYDPILSTNGPLAGRSCSSCHDQVTSFSVPTEGTAVLPHVNLAWSQNFLWTGKVNGGLEDVMRFEVNEFFQVDVSVLQAHAVYPGLFERAFGDATITNEAVAKALAQWFRRLVSTDSKFDRYLQHTEMLTDQELSGMMIYLSETGDCFHCHGIPLLTDNAFHNIGLDASFTGADQGRFLITGNPTDLGAFKAPTLRNIALTAPYMHDGRFATLEEVVEHYNSGVNPSPSLDPIMTKPGQITQLLLGPQQKADLVAFLETFTDDAFITDPELGSPF
ncbi:MAG: cytochrome-c peroxidase [Flavobacteriales bacterium]|jgi:cytochrome c peroxidase|nr:cytochrome-c peroxidase [Flavobacteriales bacterium]MBK6549276.1 cytochrome-c peroxidase [Flavobacteriales bacterium]MBK6884147.1 cytochrome-c peroxidase [Flavobacteriales bacterium]MBK7111223.1 cytochrome-c peroxidase [Flavobacteriales bacterium]MBK7618075.1 cytochrome-c peroxidase [Flavobacteriales bacterium]